MIDPAARRLALARQLADDLAASGVEFIEESGEYVVLIEPIAAALDQYGDALARAIREEEKGRVDNWRHWANFVFLTGGPCEGTDAELQKRVCEEYDANVKAGHALAQERAEELKVTELLLLERQRVLDAIPPCENHGPCVPHALEWIATAIRAMRGATPEGE